MAREDVWGCEGRGGEVGEAELWMVARERSVLWRGQGVEGGEGRGVGGGEGEVLGMAREEMVRVAREELWKAARERSA